MKKLREESERKDSHKKYLKALVDKIEPIKGDKGPIPVKGVDYYTEEEARVFLEAATPVKGEDYFDGEQGIEGPKGERGKRGEIGPVGPKGENANMEEISQEISDVMKSHEKTNDHKLLHDSKVLAGLDVDISTVQEGDLLQRKGNKWVGVKLPKNTQQFISSQGASNLRSISVTASRELDSMGIYIIDASAGNITISLPTAAGREEYMYELIRIDSSANTVTITPNGSETMSGMTDYQLVNQWSTITLFAYNGNYLMRHA